MKKSFTLLFFIITTLIVSESQGQIARLQIIHNCPDTIVDTVDVYLNDTLLIPGFAFQSATPYINAPAGVNFDLVITTFGVGDTSNPLFRKTFLLVDTNTYVIVANGEVGNPGINGFDLRTYSGQEVSTNSGVVETSLKFINSVYDAPVIDVYEIVVEEGEIFPDLGFGEDSGYADLNATDLIFQIKTQTSQILGEYEASFIPFEDSALIAMTTGYMDTSGAAGITPFGVILVLANGNVINLPSLSISPARVQIIHNCAATDATSVDVWLNAGTQPLIDNFNFRTATPFIDFPAGTPVDISICLPNSTDTSSALFKQNFILESSKTYIIIVSGTIGSGTYNPSQPFSLNVIPDAREIAEIPSDVDLMVWHGVTDAPYLDILETQLGTGSFIDNISYGSYQGYLNVPPLDYNLTIQDSSGLTDIASYDADLISYAGEAITILVSGFLSPGNNNNGPDFGLWLATAAGGDLIPLSIIIGTNEIINTPELKIFPNPVLGQIKLRGEIDQSTFKIFNVNGKVVKTGQFQKSSIQNIEIENLESGIYFIQISNDNKLLMKRFLKL